MNAFTRQINVKLLTEANARHSLIRALLLRWQPAGSAPEAVCAEGANALRLAIRDGYVNFYCGGQSVAKVNLRRVPSVHVHRKYLANGNDPATSGSNYRSVSTNPGDAEADAFVEAVMTKTLAHQGNEKKFVERVVAANSNIIDLEMGLPGFIVGEKQKVAPRMDIVALERKGDGWRIVFWEAKLSTNGEARRTGDLIPKVIEKQRANYRKWLDTDTNEERIMKEYRETCRHLVAFHRLAEEAAKATGRTIAPLGDGIRALANDSALSVDKEVRLLIDDTTHNPSFTGNGHLEKLTDALKIHVQVVQSPDQLVLETRP